MGQNTAARLEGSFLVRAFPTAGAAEAGSISGAGAARMPTGQSPAIREVVHLIQQVAAHDSSVLILGESGRWRQFAEKDLEAAHED